MVGLVFTIGGVMRALWVHSHNPENINIGRALIDKNYWVYNSYEDYYFAMGWACLIAGLGFIGLLQHLLSQSVSDNKPNIPPVNNDKTNKFSVSDNKPNIPPVNNNKLDILPIDDKKSDTLPVNDSKANIEDTKEENYVRLRSKPRHIADQRFANDGNVAIAFFIIFILVMLIISFFSKA
jgi:hypothetical protein